MAMQGLMDHYADRLLIPGLKKALEVIRSTAPGCKNCEGPYFEMIDHLEELLQSAEDAEQFKKARIHERRQREDKASKLYQEMLNTAWLRQMQGVGFAPIKK